MKFVSAVQWVRKGAGKAVPDKIHFSEEELKELISDTKHDGDEECENAVSGDEFDFAHYDNEEGSLKASIKDIVSFDEDAKKSKKVPKKKKKHSQIDDSDSEDEVIKPDDNLILVGHVDDDFNTLNVYVYNENDGDMYVHHDIILKSAPLCVEWLNASDVSEHSNLCAIGGMEPVIGIWDLDIINCIEPVYKLGRAKKRNPNKNYGHTDSVLSLAWNIELPHILCSGSVDNRSLLWDLHTGKVATELTVFSDKVQSVLWNPHDPYSLLTASADGYVRNFDCRVFDQFQKWNLKAGVECILPHPENEYYCFAATDNGFIHHIDYRKKKPIFSFQAHDKEITGLSCNKSNPGILISISADESMRFWNVNNEFECTFSKNPNLGPLYCIDMNPDYPFLACIGGSHQSRNKKIMKVMNIDTILEAPEPTIQTKLIFKNTSLPKMLFTCNKILDNNGEPLQIALVEQRGDQITPTTLTYPIKLELLVVDGDFPAVDRGVWTSKEFNDKIVRERQGRKPLLIKDINCTLIKNKNCVSIGEIEFTDNSSWIRSRRFRLAARITSDLHGHGVRILEALTEPFVVKDHRGELYKKHYPPVLSDEVWRLEKIAKDGKIHKRLAQEGVRNVQDLLKLSVIDPTRLKMILGGKTGIISDKWWDAILKHARTCNLGNKMYIYRGPMYTIILDPICQVLGIKMDGNFYPASTLADLKNEVDQLVKNYAYKNWDALEDVDRSVYEIFQPSQGNMMTEYSNPQQSIMPYEIVVGGIVEVGALQQVENNNLVELGDWEASNENLM